jgi:hypothetical protein
MSDTESDALTKELGKAVGGVMWLAEGVFYLALAALAAYALYFAYGWVLAHPKQTALIVGSCAFWIIAKWRKP